MSFELEVFDDPELDASFVEWLVDERGVDIRSHFGKLWDYYQNPREALAVTGIDADSNESARTYVHRSTGCPAG